MENCMYFNELLSKKHLHQVNITLKCQHLISACYLYLLLLLLYFFSIIEVIVAYYWLNIELIKIEYQLLISSKQIY